MPRPRHYLKWDTEKAIDFLDTLNSDKLKLKLLSMLLALTESSRAHQICYSAGNYLFKVNNSNTRTRCEICSKLTIKTPERRQGHTYLNKPAAKSYRFV